MRKVSPEHESRYLESFQSLLGQEWIEKQTKQYEAFQQRQSPPDLWSHRPPSISPIIPLLSLQRPSASRSLRPGSAYGDPAGALRLLVLGLYSFEDYWSVIPTDLFVPHLRTRLQTWESFVHFMHQLRLAEDVGTRYNEHDLHLLFLDPHTDKGAPDITLRKGIEQIEARCVTTGALHHSGLSFDLAQYVFGRFCRLIEGSRYGYRLGLTLKQSPGQAEIDNLLDRLMQAVKNGWEVVRDAQFPSFELDLIRLEAPYDGFSPAELSQIQAKDSGDAFVQVAGFSTPREKRYTRVALLSVSRGSYRTPEDYIEDGVKEGMAGQSKNPLIASVDLQRHVGWGDYLGNSSVRVNLHHRIERLIQSSTLVIYVQVYTNRPEIAMLPSDAQRTDMKSLEVPNGAFVSKGPSMYITRGGLSFHPEQPRKSSA